MASSDQRPALSSLASLERTLDRAIASLAAGTPTRESRALLIEARRLRSVIANWRSIPPPDAVRDEMVDRVLQLSASVGATPAGYDGGRPPMPPAAGAYDDAVDREPQGLVQQKARQEAATKKYPVQPKPLDAEDDAPVHDGQAAAYEADETEAYSIDFEPRMYTFEGGAAAQPPPAAPAAKPAARQFVPRPSIQMDAAVTTLQADLQPLAKASLTRRSEPPPRPPSVPPPSLAMPPASLAMPPASLAMPTASLAVPTALYGLAEERVSPPPRQPSTPARAPSVPPAPVAIAPYSYDGDADELSVPRTQVVTSPAKMPDPPDPLLSVLVEPLSSRADAYRAIRRKLATGSGARVLGVTSASPGEGKTVFALNLALTLRDGAKGGVLVVDANPISPGLAKLVGVTQPDCFLSQLARHVEDPRAPWSVMEPMPKLHVLAIDPAQKHPPILDAAAFSQGMDRLKQAGYEYIIVDAPHVLGSGNGNVIADAVDALILTALPMKSVRTQMRKAVEQLEPAPILGVVVLEG